MRQSTTPSSLPSGLNRNLAIAGNIAVPSGFGVQRIGVIVDFPDADRLPSSWRRGLRRGIFHRR
jgi:hypothetical protein